MNISQILIREGARPEDVEKFVADTKCLLSSKSSPSQGRFLVYTTWASKFRCKHYASNAQFYWPVELMKYLKELTNDNSTIAEAKFGCIYIDIHQFIECIIKR